MVLSRGWIRIFFSGACHWLDVSMYNVCFNHSIFFYLGVNITGLFVNVTQNYSCGLLKRYHVCLIGRQNLISIMFDQFCLHMAVAVCFWFTVLYMFCHNVNQVSQNYLFEIKGMKVWRYWMTLSNAESRVLLCLPEHDKKIFNFFKSCRVFFPKHLWDLTVRGKATSWATKSCKSSIFP